MRREARRDEAIGRWTSRWRYAKVYGYDFLVFWYWYCGGSDRLGSGGDSATVEGMICTGLMHMFVMLGVTELVLYFGQDTAQQHPKRTDGGSCNAT